MRSSKFIRSMYARTTPSVSEKNPNRVLGGLKGHGADHYSVLGEDGTQREVPTRAYVQGLEEKIRAQDTRILTLEKKVRKFSND